MECSICVETITASKNATCPFCNFQVCNTCLKKFITSRSDDAGCMNPDCSRGYDRDILLQLLPSSWLNKEYKKHRENVLLERETSMMPSTIPFVEHEKRKRKATKEISEMEAEKNQLRERMCIISKRQRELLRITTSNEVTPENKTFAQRCLIENCKGWLSTSWRCTRCDTITCNKCHTPLAKTKEECVGHVCNEQDVESIASILSQSTKCPDCSISIHRISGCDQMFCAPPAGCGACFSYRTGKRVNGVIHNPHYFEAMRLAGHTHREAGDIPCGGLVAPNELLRRCGAHEVSQELMNFIRLVRHIEVVELPRYRTPLETQTRSLRVQFMMGDFREEEFKKKIQRREKQEGKNREITQVLEMVQHTITDELRSFVVEKDGKASTYVRNGLNIIQYANDALNRIAQSYAQVTPRIRLSDMTVQSVIYLTHNHRRNLNYHTTINPSIPI